MTDKARELLERAIEALDFDRGIDAYDLMEEIRTYLAEPEVKREALSEDKIYEGFLDMNSIAFTNRGAFGCGVRFAEKHHGIGGKDE